MVRVHWFSRLLGKVLHGILVVAGGLACAMLLFLLLPLVQVISETPPPDLDLRVMNTADVPPPPPPPEEEPEQEPEQQDDKPPQLEEASQPLDLSQLELALNPGVSEGAMGGDFAIKLNALGASGGGGGVDDLFSLADLDQKPRVVHQPGPVLDAAARRKAPGTVHILFVVDEQGRVENPVVQKSTDPVFERPALASVRQWRFEPGKRNGKPVRFRMRVPVTFPKGS